MNTFTNAELMELGFTNWLDEVGANRGWYTCTITGEKFRGQIAEDMLAAQRAAVANAEILAEAKENESAQEQKAADEAFAQKLGQAALTTKVGVIGNQVVTLDDDKEFDEVLEYDRSITERLQMHVMEKEIAGQPVKTTQITCEDCGANRSIKVQDVFQVTRCVVCQKQHRNKKRAERRRQQRAEAKDQE